MGKRFIKFRVSRVIPSFQSCRSKDPSSLPANPVPSFLLRFNPRLPPPQQQPQPSISNPKPHRSSLKRHVSSALISARRSFLRSRPPPLPADPHTESFPRLHKYKYHWGHDQKFHVIAKISDHGHHHYTPPRRKIYTSTSEENHENDVVLFPPLNLKHRRRRRVPRRRRSFQKVRIITSSESGGVIFSDDDEINGDEDDDVETLVSTESSTPRRRRRVRKGRKSGEESPARLSEFMRKMVPCRAVEGKVRESFAVVKRSADPYEDFKRSMAEMVVEKQMFEAAELEELLRCFLSLNSVHHHGDIVRAFTEIWEALFSRPSTSS